MKPKLLYLDVDGVLLGKADPRESQIVLAAGAAEFLTFCIENFTCFWLTSHCREGDIEPLLNLFSRYAAAGFIELARKVVPAPWNTLKTEAIDFSADFYWLDDQQLFMESEIMKKHKASGRFIRVDTRKTPGDLFRALDLLKSKLY
jgi:hypothetical protein